MTTLYVSGHWLIHVYDLTMKDHNYFVTISAPFTYQLNIAKVMKVYVTNVQLCTPVKNN